MQKDIIKIKTKSGFSCEVDGNALKSRQFTRIMASASSKDSKERLRADVQLSDFILGDDEQRLCEHVMDEDGFVSQEKFEEELIEIMNIMIEKVKGAKKS